ncbi:hypothetical protein [Dapis sp. BLCC M229]|uniref:hypothetical protein n=1 Tax=Dapis sp. BLCC M229 TaxID=3400188 RepID=UPI003CEC7329
MSDKKVFVCSRALARSLDRAKALLQALIITIQPDMILLGKDFIDICWVSFLNPTTFLARAADN